MIKKNIIPKFIRRLGKERYICKEISSSKLNNLVMNLTLYW